MVLQKKKTFGFKERNEEFRKNHEEFLRDFPQEKRIYLDETGIDDNEVPEFGWGPIGERILDMKRGVCKKRYSILAALLNNRIIAPIVFEGTCCRELFENWLETVLLPIVKPESVIILDNASFHKGGRIKSLIESAGCTLLYLPPYSPDLNPIEHHWYRVKAIIKKYFTDATKGLYDWAVQAFDEILTY